MTRWRMSRIRFVLFAGLLLVLSGMALGQGFWAKKNYTQWNEKEIQKLMTDSPWAKEITLATAPPGGATLDMGGRGGGGGGGEEGEAGGGGGGGGGGGRGGGMGGNRNVVRLTVSFRSALPLKQALVKGRLGASGDLPVEAKEMLDRVETHYVVMATGLPARMVRAAQNPEELKKSAIKRGKKTAIAVENAEVVPRGQTADVLFFFPKTDPIVDADKEIEVVLRLGEFDFKKKFSLKDMVFNGKLEL